MTESSMTPQEASAAKIKQSLKILVTEWRRESEEYFKQLDVIRTTILPTLDPEERPAALAHVKTVEEATLCYLHLYILCTTTRPGEEMSDEMRADYRAYMQYHCGALPNYDTLFEA